MGKYKYVQTNYIFIFVGNFSATVTTTEIYGVKNLISPLNGRYSGKNVGHRRQRKNRTDADDAESLKH